MANGPVPYLPQYTTFSEGLTAAHEVGNFGTSLFGSFLRSTYQDVPINGILLNQTQFNGNTYTVSPKLSYLVSPPTRAFVQATFQRNAYDTGQFDSSTYAEVLGSEFEIRRLIRGNVFVGYRERYYDSAGIGSVGGITYGLNAAWFPAEVVTVKLSGRQDFADSAVLGTTSSISVVNVKTIQGEVDYEATERVILSAVAAYENDNYQSVSRIDNNIRIGANLKYLLRDGASLDFLYLYSTRQSTETGFSYDRQQVGLSLKLQY